jgi:hypothetical protein
MQGGDGHADDNEKAFKARGAHPSFDIWILAFDISMGGPMGLISLQVTLRLCKIAFWGRRELQNRNVPFEKLRRHYYDAQTNKFELKGVGHVDTVNCVGVQQAAVFNILEVVVVQGVDVSEIGRDTPGIGNGVAR